MTGNSIGKHLVLTTFGESHGVAVGGVLDGYPSNIPVDRSFIQSEVNRRNPAGYPFTSARREEDHIELLSGIFEGKSTGTPIAFMVQNKDQRPADYNHLRELYRPSHADFTWEKKYGIRDHRGGGRSSARTTIPVVAGGAFAKILLTHRGISVSGYVSAIGPHSLPEGFTFPGPGPVTASPVACPDEETTRRIIAWLEEVRAEGDTAGGVVTCVIQGAPVGLGDPVFDKLQADLAKAMMSINAVKGFEYGAGFRSAAMKGSEHNDGFTQREGSIVPASNHSGGILGGISTGMEIYFRVAFKPVSTLGKDQSTLDREGRPVTYKASGRHDICVVPRAVPIVEAMAALVIADHLLRSRPF